MNDHNLSDKYQHQLSNEDSSVKPMDYRRQKLMQKRRKQRRRALLLLVIGILLVLLIILSVRHFSRNRKEDPTPPSYDVAQSSDETGSGTLSDSGTQTEPPIESQSPVISMDTEGTIGSEAAMKTAFENAGVSMDSASDIKCILSRDDGTFEVSFAYGGIRYLYIIDSQSGMIIQYEAGKTNS